MKFRIAGLLLALLAAPAFAASDRIVTGDNVLVTGDVDSDLVAAGGQVDVNAKVKGDLLCFGGEVRQVGSVGQDVYVAGGDVTIKGDIGGNLRIAGGEVALDQDAHVGGNATVFGGDLDVAGKIDGDLRITGGQVKIDGTITGDVHATGGEVELGPNARIQGRLVYRTRGHFEQDAAAQVAGGVERGSWPERVGFQIGDWNDGSWIWTLGLAVTALFILGLTPGLAARVTDTIHDEWPVSLLFGLVALAVVPMAALLLILTIIGLPVGLIAMLLYPVLMLLGYVFGLIAAGDIGLQRARPNRQLQVNERGPRIVAALIAIAVIALIGRLPVIGGLVTLAVLLLGMGALLQQFSRKRRAAAIA